MLSFNCHFVGIGTDLPHTSVRNVDEMYEQVTATRKRGALEITTDQPVNCRKISRRATISGGQYDLSAAEGKNEDVGVHIADCILVPESLTEDDVHVHINDDEADRIGAELALEFGSQKSPALGVYLSPPDAILFLKKLMAANPEALIEQLQQAMNAAEK